MNHNTYSEHQTWAAAGSSHAVVIGERPGLWRRAKIVATKGPRARASTALFRPSILFKVAAQALRSEKSQAATAPVRYERKSQKAAGGV
ncbi:MAG TPA: hypothetical protein VKA70_20195 [Blastocatellia bacterium]|nr:hypothetical protein [Blastocatellia bacterium]